MLLSFTKISRVSAANTLSVKNVENLVENIYSNLISFIWAKKKGHSSPVIICYVIQLDTALFVIKALN